MRLLLIHTFAALASRFAVLGACAAIMLVAAGCSHDESSASGQPVAAAPVQTTSTHSTSAASSKAASDKSDDADEQVLRDFDRAAKQAGPPPKFEKFRDETIQWDPLPADSKNPVNDPATASPTADFKTPRSRQRWKVFSDGSKIRDGKYEEWYRNGQPLEVGEYVDDVRQGPWKLWHENGKPCKTENYLNGKLEGKWDVLNDKGLLEQKVSYHNGDRDGLWIVYAADGKTPVRQESYKAGDIDGPWIFYGADGKPLAVQNYKNGKFDGPQKVFYPTGKLRRVQEYKDGMADGKDIKYAEDGKTVTEESVYDRGRKISTSPTGIAAGK